MNPGRDSAGRPSTAAEPSTSAEPGTATEPGSAAVRCAVAVVEELVAAGVREAVLAPGSRSAPLALALAAADRQSLLRLHVRIDERTAGFLALGLARASGRPVPVVTTSGTAVANLHPAVLEARHAGVALVVVSADRPLTMLDTGANQTTSQLGIFGTAVRAEAMINSTDDHEASWRYQVRRLVTAATGIRSAAPGPAHLNVALAAPLVDPAPIVLRPPARRIVEPRPAAAETRLGYRAGSVVLAGDGAGAKAGRIAAEAGLPLLAEPSSGARHTDQALSAYRVLLRSTLAREIGRVVMVGHPTLSRPVTELITRPEIELIMVNDAAEWPDPGWNVSLVIGDVVIEPDPTDWLQRWRDADAVVRGGLDALPDDSGPSIAAAVLAGSAGPVVLGSSQAVRDADLAPSTPARVFANRGLSGIDGTLSTAVGIALATGEPTHLLCGDLTFLHDSNALVIGPGEPRPDLRIVVLDDDGGAIFATLEQGGRDYATDFDRVFTTPHGTDLAALGAAHHVPVTSATGARELAVALQTPPVGLEIVLVTPDRDRRAEAARVATLAERIR